MHIMEDCVLRRYPALAGVIVDAAGGVVGFADVADPDCLTGAFGLGVLGGGYVVQK